MGYGSDGLRTLGVGAFKSYLKVCYQFAVRSLRSFSVQSETFVSWQDQQCEKFIASDQ